MGKDIGFCNWVGKRLLLDHLNLSVHPTLHILKSMLAVALTLLIDRFTKNPDSVSSTFTALLCVTPTIMSEWNTAKDILGTSILGTVLGLACEVAWSAGDLSLVALKSESDWWLLFRVPLAVALTTYFCLVLGKRDPGSLTAGMFTALYVQFVGFNWPWAYKPVWLDYIVFSTTAVRVLAQVTGIVAAFVANALASAFLLSVIFEKQFKNMQWIIDDAVETMREDPLANSVQAAFVTLEDYEENLRGAIDELNHRHKVCLGDEVTKKRLRSHLKSCIADQRMLCIQQAIGVLAGLPDITQEEKEFCRTIYRALTRRQHLFPEKDLLDKLPAGNGMLVKFMKILISHVEERAPMSVMLTTDSTWYSQSRRNLQPLLPTPQPSLENL